MYLFYLIGGKIMGKMRLYRLKDIEIPCFTKQEADTFQSFFKLLGIRVKTTIFNSKLLRKVVPGIDKENLNMDFKTIREYLKEDYYSDELFEECFDKVLEVFLNYHLEENMYIMTNKLSWKYSKDLDQVFFDVTMELRKIYFRYNNKNPYIENSILVYLFLNNNKVVKDGYRAIFEDILYAIYVDIKEKYNDFFLARINFVKCCESLGCLLPLYMFREAEKLLSENITAEEKLEVNITLFFCYKNMTRYITNKQLIYCAQSILKIEKSIRTYLYLGEAYNITYNAMDGRPGIERTWEEKKIWEEMKKEDYPSKARDAYKRCIQLLEEKDFPTTFDIKHVFIARSRLISMNRERAEIAGYLKFVEKLKNGKYTEGLKKQLGEEDAKRWIENAIQNRKDFIYIYQNYLNSFLG